MFTSIIKCGQKLINHSNFKRLRWSLGMDFQFQSTIWTYDYLPTMGLKLIHVSKRGPRSFYLFKGLRPVLEGFVVPMHEGVSPRDLTYCSHKPECIGTTNPDRSVLIPIITWHFQFRPVNVSILHLKYEYCARSESRFACYPHCYVMWCPLTTGIVASQFPSSRDAALVTRYLTPFISAYLNLLKRFLPR